MGTREGGGEDNVQFPYCSEMKQIQRCPDFKEYIHSTFRVTGYSLLINYS